MSDLNAIYLVNDLGKVYLMWAAGDETTGVGEVTSKNLEKLFGDQQRFVLMTDEYFRELQQ